MLKAVLRNAQDNAKSVIRHDEGNAKAVIRHSDGNARGNTKINPKDNAKCKSKKYSIFSSAKQCFSTSIVKQLKENAVPKATSLEF